MEDEIGKKKQSSTPSSPNASLSPQMAVAQATELVESMKLSSRERLEDQKRRVSAFEDAQKDLLEDHSTSIPQPKAPLDPIQLFNGVRGRVVGTECSASFFRILQYLHAVPPGVGENKDRATAIWNLVEQFTRALVRPDVNVRKDGKFRNQLSDLITAKQMIDKRIESARAYAKSMNEKNKVILKDLERRIAVAKAQGEAEGIKRLLLAKEKHGRQLNVLGCEIAELRLEVKRLKSRNSEENMDEVADTMESSLRQIQKLEEEVERLEEENNELLDELDRKDEMLESLANSFEGKLRDVLRKDRNRSQMPRLSDTMSETASVDSVEQVARASTMKFRQQMNFRARQVVSMHEGRRSPARAKIRMKKTKSVPIPRLMEEVSVSDPPSGGSLVFDGEGRESMRQQRQKEEMDLRRKAGEIARQRQIEEVDRVQSKVLTTLEEEEAAEYARLERIAEEVDAKEEIGGSTKEEIIVEEMQEEEERRKAAEAKQKEEGKMMEEVRRKEEEEKKAKEAEAKQIEKERREEEARRKEEEKKAKEAEVKQKEEMKRKAAEAKQKEEEARRKEEEKKAKEAEAKKQEIVGEAGSLLEVLSQVGSEPANPEEDDIMAMLSQLEGLE